MDKLVVGILQARKRIRRHVRHTPLEFSSALSALGKGSKVYIKLESEQLTGSFKLRGAFNKTLLLHDENKTKHGVITASTGNHGIACLTACKEVNIPLTVFCRSGVDVAKKTRLETEGATVRLHGEDCVDAELEARRYAQEKNVPFISPYNDLDVVAGQGTIGVEILEDLPEVDVVLVPVGGGGLIAGIARYIKQVKPSAQIVGCSPVNSKVMHESVKAGKVIFEESKDTLSDGTVGGLEEDTVTFDLCRQYVDEWMLVTEDEIAQALIFLLEHHHKVVEGSAGLSLGAYINHVERFKDKNVVIIACGSNISPLVLQNVLNCAND